MKMNTLYFKLILAQIRVKCELGRRAERLDDWLYTISQTVKCVVPKQVRT